MLLSLSASPFLCLCLWLISFSSPQRNPNNLPYILEQSIQRPQSVDQDTHAPYLPSTYQSTECLLLIEQSESRDVGMRLVKKKNGSELFVSFRNCSAEIRSLPARYN